MWVAHLCSSCGSSVCLAHKNICRDSEWTWGQQATPAPVSTIHSLVMKAKSQRGGRRTLRAKREEDVERESCERMGAVDRSGPGPLCQDVMTQLETKSWSDLASTKGADFPLVIAVLA